MIKLAQHLSNFINPVDLSAETDRAKSLLPELSADPMAGWLDLPETYSREEFAAIQAAATEIRQTSDYLICIGIGGSYLGAKAIIEALSCRNASDVNPLGNAPAGGHFQGGEVREQSEKTKLTKILFAGNSLSPLELQKVLAELGDSDFSINIISKSGTTLEPALAFRIFKQKLIEKYGEPDAYTRIYATTDAAKGTLHDEAQANGYTTFIVPDNIGGRYSVLTPVGLLPIAVAGIDISALMSGAAEQRSAGPNSAISYAAARNLLLEKGYDIEILATFEPSLLYLNEWWKQLFGESEGKDGKGIFPASAIYTTDLHSMGQYLQDGRRALQETVIRFATTPIDLPVSTSQNNSDGLNYLAGKNLSYINDQALTATVEAHLSGGVPVTELKLPDLSAHSLGALIYFFELSCALSAKLLGVNPFDQPGVEAYKTNMFRLLGKYD